MIHLAIIGGTGLTRLEELDPGRREGTITPFGELSAPLTFGRYAGMEIVFLPRHGDGHVIPPHRINYRANIRALKDCGVERILAVNAVGGITGEMTPCRIVIPDQIIDYTWGRKHSFFEDGPEVSHIDFTRPYAGPLRETLLKAAREAGVDVVDRATYGATQGPRLETAAEIDRMERDGCDIVGMTGMPEAALAREVDLDYACIAVVVNWAAGKTEKEITMDEIKKNLGQGMADVQRLLQAIIASL
ncbi:MAG: S-methyl-5'-thioinosine phosphorylase [Gammaproteobacteria bacterium]